MGLGVLDGAGGQAAEVITQALPDGAVAGAATHEVVDGGVGLADEFYPLDSGLFGVF